MEFQDIITKEPITVKTISAKQDDEAIKILMDENYFPIITALRKHPMTVKELVKEYNKIAEEEKSDKTIYRYLKTLEKVDLVVPVGQRVVIGKTATETLYGRTALCFKPIEYKEGWWLSEEGAKMAQKINILVSKALNTKEASIDLLQKFLAELTVGETAIIDELANSDVASEFYMDGGFDEISELMDAVGRIILLLRRPDLIEELQKGYKG